MSNLQQHIKYTPAKQLTILAKNLYFNVSDWVLNTRLLNYVKENIILQHIYLTNSFWYGKIIIYLCRNIITICISVIWYIPGKYLYSISIVSRKII